MTSKTTVAGVDLSEKEIKDAKKEGVLDAVKDGAKESVASDSGTTSYEAAEHDERVRVPASFESTFKAPLLDLPVDELKKRLTDPKVEHPIPESDAPGLLALERAAKNRTDYVKMLCGVIGVKSPTEVTSAGPSYTNDTTNITDL